MKKLFVFVSAVLWLLQANAGFAQSCTYTVNMFDDFGDGWNGTQVAVYQGGSIVSTLGSNFGFSSGNPPGFAIDTTVQLTTGLNTYFVLSTGSLGGPFYTEEVSFDVVDPFGIPVGSYPIGLPQVGDTLLSFMANCTPPSCFPPTALGYTPVSNTSAEIFWTGGGAPDHNVEYGPAGFLRGAGTFLNVPTDTVLISGLTSNLAYEYYVRDSCAQGDVSIWRGPFPFGAVTNDCDDFEAYSLGPLVPQSILFGEFQGPAGDAFVSNDQAHSGSQSLKIQNNGPSMVSQVFADVGPYTSGVWSFSFEIYIPSAFGGTGGGYALISDFDNLLIPMIVYLEAGLGRVSDVNDNTLGTFNYALDSWNSIEHIIDLDNDTAYVIVNNVAGAGIQFSGGLGNPQFESFLFSTEATPTGTVVSYIDDFCITPFTAPSCPSPGNLGAFGLASDSANIYWAPGGASNFEVVYGLAGFNLPGGGTQFTTTDDTVSLGGLTSNTAYEFYVRDSCGSGDVSLWSGPYRFRTPCETVMLPYIEAWETSSTTRDCWNLQGEWQVDTASAYGSGTYSLGFPFYDVFPGTMGMVAYSAEFTPTPGTNYQLSFDHAYATYTTEVDTLEIMYSTDAGSSYQSLTVLYGGTSGALATAPPTPMPFTPSSSQWASAQVALPAGTNRLAFVAGSAFGNNLYLDNISVEAIEGCNAGSSVMDSICDSLATVDLAAYIGTHSFGGTWYDDDGSGALTDSTFNVASVTPMASYNFTYVVTSGICTDSATVSLYVDDCDISLNEYDHMAPRIYPNPTTGKIFLEKTPGTNDFKVEVYSINGQLLQSKHGAEEKIEIDLSEYADGVYHLRVLGDNTVQVHRVIKE